MSKAIQDQLEHGSQWLQQLLDLCGFPATVSSDMVEPLSHEHVESGADAVAWLTIESQELNEAQTSWLIGENGQVLDAIQYLASLELNFKAEKEAQLPFVVDLNGYRERRQGELKQLVEETAATVQASGQAHEVCGLSSAERREVHTMLKALFPDLTTFSRGKEPDRRLVVQPRALEKLEP
jgi:spoIIIJ-associated protein